LTISSKAITIKNYYLIALCFAGKAVQKRAGQNWRTFKQVNTYQTIQTRTKVLPGRRGIPRRTEQIKVSR
jgi:hypothetical protein